MFFKNSCYKTSLSPLLTMLTWDQAVDACRSEGGYLAVIRSAEEDAFIINLKNSIARGVGLIYQNIIHWIGLRTDEQYNTTSWVTGEAYGYSNIKMVDGQSGLCYGIKGDVWVEAGCIGSCPYICEKPYK